MIISCTYTIKKIQHQRLPTIASQGGWIINSNNSNEPGELKVFPLLIVSLGKP